MHWGFLINFVNCQQTEYTAIWGGSVQSWSKMKPNNSSLRFERSFNVAGCMHAGLQRVWIQSSVRLDVLYSNQSKHTAPQQQEQIHKLLYIHVRPLWIKLHKLISLIYCPSTSNCWASLRIWEKKKAGIHLQRTEQILIVIPLTTTK